MNENQILTIGDIDRSPEFGAYTRRQIEYAIQEARIEPIGRLGIIRAFSRDQLPLIMAALRRTSRATGVSSR